MLILPTVANLNISKDGAVSPF